MNANIFGRQVEAHKMFCIKGMFHKKISQKVWMKAVLPDEITFYIKQKVQKELNARGKSSGSSWNEPVSCFAQPLTIRQWKASSLDYHQQYFFITCSTHPPTRCSWYLADRNQLWCTFEHSHVSMLFSHIRHIVGKRLTWWHLKHPAEHLMCWRRQWPDIQEKNKVENSTFVKKINQSAHDLKLLKGRSHST